MSHDRRRFLQGSLAAVALFSRSARLRAAGAGERMVVGQIGCGPQGSRHLATARDCGDIDVAFVCDPDAKRLSAAQASTDRARAVGDFRRILDDPAVDAVMIATPDHWHAPIALLAIQAGKHVYVEKPCAHNFREGQRLRDAARDCQLIVQHGTQARSCPGFVEAIQMLREGVIGNVLAAKAWNVQRRENIGHGVPSPPPEELDYELWLGPAEEMPFQANRHHYHWHWWYNYGCGDLGNDGIHHLDYTRWGLGVDGLPSRIAAVGGKYYFDDDQQFPDTQQVVFEYPGDGRVGSRRMLIYEQRLWSTTYPHNVDSGAEFYGTEGEMMISARGKFRLLGPRNQRIDRGLTASTKYEVFDHVRNWVDSIKAGRPPRAPMDIAHDSAGLVHLGNIATRLGRTLDFDPRQERILHDEEANGLLSRRYRTAGHWAIPDRI